ncbi:MAG: hypothetical protein COA83_03635 [Methylophaga sp.]|nr:MAG: hypothetical protein COA83_03635 [Methylophaga sp.]
MTKTTKALLLSAFAYPGGGQIFLKRYLSGMVFISISTIGFYYVLKNTFQIAFQIIEQVKNGAAPPDFTTLLSLVSQHDTQLLNNVITIMLITWLVSIVHIYFIEKNTIENISTG